jgi:hypothetical protein
MSLKVYNSKPIVNMISINPPPPPIPSPINYNILQHSITDWMTAILKTGADKKVAPTKGSRFYFLAASILVDSWNVLNNISFDMFTQLPQLKVNVSELQIDIWIELCAYNGLVQLLNSFSYPLSYIDAVKEQHQTQYPTLYAMMNSYTNSLDTWLERVNAYISLRNNDGSANANEPSSNLPNPDTYINTTVIQDLNNPDVLPDSNDWTRLNITNDGQDIKQSYLTPKWGDVVGVLSNDITSKLKDDVNINFWPSNTLHQTETQDVLDISQNLTTLQKIIAEFWSGGPGTVTPPGIWLLFGTYCVYHHKLSTLSELKLYKQLTSGLFQASILCWNVKRAKVQERPIQAIRQLPETMISNWTSSEQISSKLWMPYQELNFVTPPFPDFVSGHSTFSGVASRVLTNFFGSNIIPDGKVTLSKEQMKLISPLFNDKSDSQCNICNVLIYPETSKIETGIPETGVCLNWVTWDQMAEEAGKSRIYGGIHYESSNQGGLSLGRTLANYIINL